jgi:hypothetical protein
MMQMRFDIGFSSTLIPSEKKRHKWVTLWTFWLNNLWIEYDKDSGFTGGTHGN